MASRPSPRRRERAELTDPALLGALAAAVGEQHVLADSGLRASYETDWTGRFSGRCDAVVRPGSAGEVAAVVAACRAHETAIVPQGGNTGLVGGGVPRDGGVVLCLTRLDAIDDVDPLNRTLTAAAGATLAGAQAAAAGHGLRVTLDFGARDSATLGGIAATNAGGTGAVRFGSARAQVLGLEAVLGTGQLIERTRGLRKDNVGYDLTGLLVGSEGTLGVITRVLLRLDALPRYRAAALIGLPTIDAAVDAALLLLRELPALEAAELMLAGGMQLVCGQLGLPLPLAAPSAVYLLVESAGGQPQLGRLAEAVAELALADDAVLAEDEADRRRLWALREGQSEAVVRDARPPHKLDVTLPLDVLAEFVERCDRAIAALDPAFTVITYGHVGDGNLHVNVLGPEPDDERVDDVVLRLVAEMGGSISAEHGIGVAKASRLGMGRTRADIEAMRAVKAALDPDGIMNPGVIFPSM
jgi:FAD/FMN-containing dehydrogenase